MGQIGQLTLGQRYPADLAGLGVDLLTVVHHHRHRQTGQAALLLAGIADLPIQFEVAGGLLAGIARSGSYHHRLTGLRINHLLRHLGGARRLVAQRPRNTLWSLPSGTLLAHHLLAAQGGFGIEVLGGGLQGTEIHIGGDFRLVVAVAQHRLQDAVYPAGKGFLKAAGMIELATGDGQLVQLILIRQQVAVLINYRDLILAQLRHAGRHQIDDSHHLGGLQLAPGIQLQQHRGTGLAIIADEHGRARHGDMHPRRLDVVQTGNGPRHFSFQPPAVLRSLHELAGTQTALAVEDLETDIAIALHHPGTGQLQAGVRQIFRAHQQRAAVGLDLVTDPALLQHLDHLTGIEVIHAAVQRTVFRLLRPEHHGKADRHTRRQTHQQRELAHHRQLGQVLQKAQPRQRTDRRFGSRVRAGGRSIGGRSIHQAYPRSDRVQWVR